MLSYPTLEEKSEISFFGISNLYPEYIFSSKDPEIITPVNWHLNVARNCIERKISYNSMITLSIPTIAAHQNIYGFEFELPMSLEEISDMNIRNSLGIDEDFDDEYD